MALFIERESTRFKYELYGVRPNTLSGSVKINGLGVERKLFCFKNQSFDELPLITYSDKTSGYFSFDLLGGGPNDRYDIICAGEDDSENSSIFSKIIPE